MAHPNPDSPPSSSSSSSTATPAEDNASGNDKQAFGDPEMERVKIERVLAQAQAYFAKVKRDKDGGGRDAGEEGVLEGLREIVSALDGGDGETDGDEKTNGDEKMDDGSQGAGGGKKDDDASQGASGDMEDDDNASNPTDQDLPNDEQHGWSWGWSWAYYASLPKWLKQWIKDNPRQTIFYIANGIVIFMPGLVTMPVLQAMGFGSAGPIAGYLAPWFQSFASTPMPFSFFQSLRMGGWAAVKMHWAMRGAAAANGARGWWISTGGDGGEQPGQGEGETEGGGVMTLREQEELEQHAASGKMEL